MISAKPMFACSHALMLAVVVGLLSCAQASSPPGAPPQRDAPRVVSTIPEQGAIVPDFNGPVRIRFDKTLSERGTRPADVIAISPEPEAIDVHRGGKEVRVQLKGGWKKGVVYHVTVLPGLQDRFGNARNSSYELVFSTGPDIPSTALGGVVMDRLTGRPVQNARVRATSTADSTAYVTLTDTAGFFALRSLPPQLYDVMAFVDQNRNRKADNLEARDVRPVRIATTHDTLVTEFSVLALDTTPARLLKAEARDSQQVRLVFDDFIDIDTPLSGVRVSLFHLPDSTQLGGALMRVREYEARQRALHPDTTAARRDTAAPAVLRGAARDTSKALPSEELVWQTLVPLIPRNRYRVIVQGVTNIRGIPNGGGNVTFEAPTRTRLAPTDTTKAPAARPDTSKARVKPDTSRAAPVNPRKAVKPLKPDTSGIRR